jgi:hypothetical protein
VFSEDLTAGCSSFITSIVNSDDCVSRASLHSAIEVLNAIAEQDAAVYTRKLAHTHLGESAASKVGWAMDQFASESASNPPVALPAPAMPHLYPAGRCIHLVCTSTPESTHAAETDGEEQQVKMGKKAKKAKKKEQPKYTDRVYTAMDVPYTRFTHMAFAPTMAEDHLGSQYKHAIRSAFGGKIFF